MSRDDDFDNGRQDDFRDERFDDDYDDYDRPPKKGMSTGVKILLFLLALGGIGIAVCCGGVFMVGRQFSNSFTQDPVRIAAIREEITAIDMPEGVEGKAGMDLNLGFAQMKMSIFSDDPNAGPSGQGANRGDSTLIMLMQMQVSGQTDEQMKMQFRQQAQAQSGNENVRIESTETRTFTINDQECDFVFAKGTTDDGQAIRQVSGMFPSRNGMGFLMLMVPEEKWDEAAVTGMIESIHK